MNPLPLLALLVGCAGSTSDDSAAVDPNAPTLAFVSPLDGDTVPIGALELTFAVENFPLVDPGEHTEFEDGYISLSYTSQGYELSETTSSLTDEINIADAGDHAIDAELYTAEGDPLDPRVTASITVTVSPG